MATLQIPSIAYGIRYEYGIFDQAIRDYAHFRAPIVPLKGPGYNLLGDHFHPLIAVLAPLYWIWDDARMLLIAQAALWRDPLFDLGIAVVVLGDQIDVRRA